MIKPCSIIIITPYTITNPFDGGLYEDLIVTFSEKIDNVYVISPSSAPKTCIRQLENITILDLKTTRMSKESSIIKKAFAQYSFGNSISKEFIKHFPTISIDAIIYASPPITVAKSIVKLKSYFNCITYLMLKDIFPQNAVDLGLMRANSIAHKYYMHIEKRFYGISDYIGCMSIENIRYINKKHPKLSEKLELFPNAIRIRDKKHSNSQNDAVEFVYGGNLGKPQAPEFICEVIKNFYKVKNAKLTIIGSGTSFEKVRSAVISTDNPDITMIEQIPKADYDNLLKNADIGLIFLDYRFTIPNFPSRLLSYLEFGKPIFAATDETTDLKDIIKNNCIGVWTPSNSVESFIREANFLVKNKALRDKMGENGRGILENQFDVVKNIDTILNKIKRS